MTPDPVANPVAGVSVTVAQKYQPLLAPGGGVRGRFGNYLEELLHALGLSARDAIDIVVSDVPSQGSDILLEIEGTPVMVRSGIELDAEGLTQLISDALYRCRVLLLDESTIAGLWSELVFRAQGTAVGGPPVEFAQLCRELVRRGISLARVGAHSHRLVDAASRAATVAQLIEELMAQADCGGIRLLVSGEQYARCFDGDGKALPLPDEDQDISGMLRMMADGLFWELGIAFRIDGMKVDPTLPAPWFRIAWNDVVTPPMKGLASNEFLVNDTVDRLGLLNLEGVAQSAVAINPANGIECARIGGGGRAARAYRDAGLTTWGPDAYLILHASSEIRRNAGAFVTSNLTKLYEAQYEQEQWFPELVEQTLKRFEHDELNRILRLLVDEELSLRDLRGIFEALLAVNSVTTADMSKLIVFAGHCGLVCPVATPRSVEDLLAADYADCVRIAMKRYISHKYTRGGSTLVVYLLDPAIEERLRRNEPLSTEERRELLDAVNIELGNLPRTYQSPVMLTTQDIRRRMHDHLQFDFPNTAVLSYQELSPDMNIQPIARISSRGKLLSHAEAKR